MSLTEDERFAQLAEALYIERMEMLPEKRMLLSILLENLRWFKMICAKESKSFDEITPEFLIERFTGQHVQAGELRALALEVEDEMNRVELTKSSLPNLRSRKGHTKPRNK